MLLQVLNTLSASEGAGIEFTNSMNGDKKLIAMYMFRILSKQSQLAFKELEHSQRLDNMKRLQTGHLIFSLFHSGGGHAGTSRMGVGLVVSLKCEVQSRDILFSGSRSGQRDGF